ncbi:hypothetical protein J2847_002826 [Azospirillum agricola]|nr:hypothetical protein [Azospirillum agricola]
MAADDEIPKAELKGYVFRPAAEQTGEFLFCLWIARDVF